MLYLKALTQVLLQSYGEPKARKRTEGRRLVEFPCNLGLGTTPFKFIFAKIKYMGSDFFIWDQASYMFWQKQGNNRLS